MFADTHLIDVTRLSTLGYPLPYLFLVLPFLYLFTLTPTACIFRPLADPSTSNKPLTLATPRFDQQFLLGMLAGTFVLLQSNVAGMACASIGLFYSVLSHRPL
jgi:hypothetical protein